MHPVIKLIINFSFIILFGVLGYFYFDHIVFLVNTLIYKMKFILGMESARDLIAFKQLPAWANTAFGSIVGWVVRNIFIWVYNKFIKPYFSNKRKRQIKFKGG